MTLSRQSAVEGEQPGAAESDAAAVRERDVAAGEDPGSDVVATVAQAQAQARPPLIVLEPLAEFLDRSGIGSGPVRAAPIGEGHSNVTYELRRKGASVVVRRPPRPPLPPSAHDVLREARMLTLLHRAGVRVPKVLATCEDPQVIGMPFYVMERLDGHVLGHTLAPGLSDMTARRRIGTELVDALIELHAVDVQAAGLDSFGRPDGYLARQLHRFSSIWETVSSRPLPEVEKVGAWLAAHIPPSQESTIVHGDYRLGNVMFACGGHAELLAVLDWEMATIGDPLADVGYMSATWAEAEDEENPMLALSAATRLPGFLSRGELCERYASATGRDLESLRWYEALALWKSVVFLESSYTRYMHGTTDDPYFARLEEGVPSLARAALRVTRA